MMPMKLFFLYRPVMPSILCITFSLPAPYDSAVFSVYLFSSVDFRLKFNGFHQSQNNA